MICLFIKHHVMIWTVSLFFVLAQPPFVASDSGVLQDLEVHIIDVGQGDSIFIKLPNQQNMLIDAGDSRSAPVVIEYLESESVEKIDYLFVTHHHYDHIGGIPAVIDRFDIGSLYIPKISLAEVTLNEDEFEVIVAKAGMNIFFSPDLQIEILAPVRDDYANLNNHSIVLKLIYGATSFLFMGDAEAISERDLVGDISVDVLKVGHHGSSAATTQTFLNRVAPAYAVISVGTNNLGYPCNNVLKRLANAGVDVFRTDLHGTVVFKSDGVGVMKY